jgi:subtilisin family serine protease
VPRFTNTNGPNSDTENGNLHLIAPGVGIVSTWLGKKYGQDSGTSMACPIVTAAAAVLLSKDDDILSSDSNRNKSDRIRNLVRNNAVTMGFFQEHEGSGVIPEENLNT